MDRVELKQYLEKKRVMVLLILIICFINNPILKAVMSVGLVIILVTAAK